MNLNLLK